MMRVAIVGAGIVGATVAYVLSEFVDVVVYEAAPGPPVMTAGAMTSGRSLTIASATGAALGLLMGAVSTREKGRNLEMRLAGIDWYDRVIPTLQADGPILYNQQGLLLLQFEQERRGRWEQLGRIRQAQGRRLEYWEGDRIAEVFPEVCLEAVVGAVYSPGDRQVDAAALTRALIQTSQRRGVRFEFGWEVGDLDVVEADVVVVCAGVGSVGLVDVEMRSVLGQAVKVRLPKALGTPEFQPVLSGHDIHLVPLGNNEYWLGATVEFDNESAMPPEPEAERFETMMAEIMALVPSLQDAEVLMRWHGWRPRPQGRPAPVIEWWSDRVILASGHYRNGVLLAPATALRVQEMLGLGSA
ncbi:MAG: FAD-binding oxidoreductase [Alkalinema sp. RU_4_3]|nr:FAD-binding oxidoreductase [Alkalinema sp. RU_4_3]